MSGKLQKELNKSKAKKKAYHAFQIYMRTLWTIKGSTKCYTCDRPLNFKKVQVGHWVEGHANATYINEDYIKPQCFYCNIQLGGNQGEFRDRIRQELGNEIVNQLLANARFTKDISVKDYLALEQFYENALISLII